jgi:hypothetical protein
MERLAMFKRECLRVFTEVGRQYEKYNRKNIWAFRLLRKI